MNKCKKSPALFLAFMLAFSVPAAATAYASEQPVAESIMSEETSTEVSVTAPVDEEPDTEALDAARVIFPQTHREPEFYETLLENLTLEIRMLELGGKYSQTGIPAVALTFDDGPSDETSRLLDLLEAADAKATFFIVGKNVSGKEDIVKREADLGCELGSHTWDHSDLASLTLEQVDDQLNRSISAIEEAAGQEVTVMRPPWGSSTQEIRDHLEIPVILWSLDTLDWQTRNTASTVSTVQSGIQGGDIILFHDLYTETVDAVEELLPWLSEQGYLCLTVTELYYYYDCELDLHKAHGNAR